MINNTTYYKRFSPTPTSLNEERDLHYIVKRVIIPNERGVHHMERVRDMWKMKSMPPLKELQHIATTMREER